jgi:hypothetical protein
MRNVGSMPPLVWLYRTAWLYDRTSGRCVALAAALETVSHDRLTRRLQADWSGPTLLAVAWRTLCVGERGDLILADTVIPKPCATALEGRVWVFSSQARQPVYGFSLGLLIWTNGTLRLPRGLRLWRQGGPPRTSSHGSYGAMPATVCTVVGVWRLRRLVPIQGAAQAPSGRRVVLRVSPEQEAPVQGSPPSALSAPSFLGGHRLAERGPQRADGQTRHTVLCHQSPDAAGHRGATGVSPPRANRGREPRLYGSPPVAWRSSTRRKGPTASLCRLPGRLLCAGAGTAGSSAAYCPTHAAAQVQGAFLCIPSSRAAQKRS